MWSELAKQWHIIFEKKIGIAITPYKERMIAGSESPNATYSVQSFDSGIVY